MQKSIDVPSELAGQALTLHFSSIDDDDVTYFNNSEAGRTIGVGNQRNYTVPGNLVKAGSNVITVRVLDTDSRWFGVTYTADRPGVVEKFAELHRGGEYPSPLFGK